MTNIEFILSLQPLYDNWKKNQVFTPTLEQGAMLQNVHREIFGRGLPNCSTCVTEAVQSLLIWARVKQDEIDKAQMADDEHSKPKRPRK